jgi:lysozyme family protein
MAASNFARSLAQTLEYEGGYSDDPGDRGGKTMWGITHARYDEWRRSQGQEFFVVSRRVRA